MSHKHLHDDYYPDFFLQQVLETSICSFLKTTAIWNIAWFNKPKFHLLLHLPAHIRAFGPAILFATEGFESFNAVIRLQSIHSNRGAPSRDIARDFSYMHAVQHLVSGGWYRVQDSRKISTWRQAGENVRDLAGDPLYQQLMGLASVLERGEGPLEDISSELGSFEH